VRLALVVASGEGDDALRRRDALDAAQRSRVERGVVAGVGLGSPARLDAWRGAGAGRVVAALAVHGSTPPTAAELSACRQARRDGRIAALEILAQRRESPPDDPRLEPWWALAEELELPVAISLGPPSRTAPDPRYRVALGDPLRLEPVLLRTRDCASPWRRPAGRSRTRWRRSCAPYPQVFVDTGGIALGLERAELHAYVGGSSTPASRSDPVRVGGGGAGAGRRAIEAVESATFLNPEQRRAILHDNAARWWGPRRSRAEPPRSRDAPASGPVLHWGHFRKRDTHAADAGASAARGTGLRARAGARRGPELQVNSYTTGYQRQPQVAADADGNFVVVWSGFGPSLFGYGVFARRFDDAATPIADEFVVNGFTSAHGASIAMNGTGSFVVVWQSGQDNSFDGVFAEKYDGSGTPVTGVLR
jgi:hypothetical protein